MKVFKVLGKKGRITIPYEIRTKVGFEYNDVLSFTEENGEIVIKKEKVCNKCINDLDKMPVTSYLDGLTEEEQEQALIHLSVKWAAKRGD